MVVFTLQGNLHLYLYIDIRSAPVPGEALYDEANKDALMRYEENVVNGTNLSKKGAPPWMISDHRKQ